ncbi:hypothetical protein V7x_54820 [Crateriforma conspicua]|uniref:DUF3987 domain-containing protein n=1 Tax=Crateriforma conspicua TaxID=2527996 RepID=A0A5C6FD69_9PLAN|nr:YfjI family protein [Crateriforma conspicua]TWU59708.1 hypothetical protein V7x_54820 [Crateriforma conspicua]
MSGTNGDALISKSELIGRVLSYKKDRGVKLKILPDGNVVASGETENEKAYARACSKLISFNRGHMAELADEIIGDASDDEYQSFPTWCLPEPFDVFVDEGAKSIGCDESYIALPLLSCAGAAIGNTCRLTMKSGFHAPPAIWTMIIGDSGTKKSPAFKLAGQSFHRHHNRMIKENQQARDAYNAELAEYEASKKSKGAALEKPVEPNPNRCKTTDATVESLAPILSCNPRGLLVAKDELSGWFGGLNQYKNAAGSDEAHYLSMFDGDSVTVDRKADWQCPIHIESALVSITGGIQPGVLSRSLGRAHQESGMAARFLMAQPPDRPAKWTEDVVSTSVLSLVDEVFDGLFGIQFQDEENTPHFLSLARDARQRWKEYHDDHDEEQVELSGAIKAAWSKLRGYAPRIALVIHVVTQVHNGDPITEPVTDDALHRAIRLVEWFKREAGRLYSTIDDTSEQRELRELADWIKRKHGGECTPSEISRGRWNVKNADEAERLCIDLVRMNLATWHTEKPPRGRERRFVRIT